jgi:hypothetical protein
MMSDHRPSAGALHWSGFIQTGNRNRSSIFAFVAFFSDGELVSTLPENALAGRRVDGAMTPDPANAQGDLQ